MCDRDAECCANCVYFDGYNMLFGGDGEPRGECTHEYNWRPSRGNLETHSEDFCQGFTTKYAEEE